MSLTLLLSEIEEANLRAKARAEGTTPEALVRSAIAPIISNGDGQISDNSEQPLSLLGLWSEFGPGPSAEEIDANRAEMFSSFGREDIA
jgi:hypothetical protein